MLVSVFSNTESDSNPIKGVMVLVFFSNKMSGVFLRQKGLMVVVCSPDKRSVDSCVFQYKK